MTADALANPVVFVDQAVARAWLTEHRDRLGLDAGANHADDTVIACLDDLIAALREAGPTAGWRQLPPLDTVGVWRTAGCDGVINGVIVTADLRIGDRAIRLATRHHDPNDILGRTLTDMVDAACHALESIATLVNQILADCRGPAAGLEPGPVRWDENAITDALNAAADDVLEVTDADDEGLVDAVNLLVNATVHYLREPAGADADSARERLAAVAADNYSTDLDIILGWIDAGIR